MSPQVNRPRRRIAVIGGSMAGLIAAMLLRKKGFNVEIFERSGSELASRGAGISPHQELFSAFRQAGVNIEQAMGVKCHGRLFLAADGAVIAATDTPQLFTSWGLLYRLLRSNFPDENYHNGAVATTIEQAKREVIVDFQDGSHGTYDWLIGADGLRSVIRAQVAPDLQQKYTGYVAWRGLVAESCLTGCAADLSERLTFYLPPGEHMLGYTVAGPNDTLTPGQRWYNWVWYRPMPAGQAYAEMFSDAVGVFYPDGIPPHLIRPEIITAMRTDAQRLLPPQFRTVIEHTEQPFLQPISELASAQLVFDRVVLIGDAAFTVRPHIGFGVSKAAADAATLASVFDRPSETITTALQAWQGSRLRFGNAVLARSAELGCYLSGDPQTPSDVARFEHFRRSDIVLAGIAAAQPHQFLHL